MHDYIRRGVIRRVTVVLSAALLALVVAYTASSASGARVASNKLNVGQLHFILVSHSPSTDPYWAVEANGLKQAGADLGIKTAYRGVQQNLQDPNEERRLILAAIASKPSGLIVTDPYPTSLDPAIKQATRAGIPVVIINSGIGETAKTGALTVIANDESKAGLIGGQRMKALGVKHPLVVDTPPGAIPLVDQRASGFIKGFGGQVTRVHIPTASLNDAVFIKNAVEATLTKDSAVDGVFSTGSAFSPALLQVRSDLGSRGTQMKWASIDLGDPVVSALENHTWAFALDQQQFSQPYMAAVALDLYIKYGIAPATDFIPTGPGVVTPANVARIAALQKKGVR